jgi:hypothetical protein
MLLHDIEKDSRFELSYHLSRFRVDVADRMHSPQFRCQNPKACFLFPRMMTRVYFIISRWRKCTRIGRHNASFIVDSVQGPPAIRSLIETRHNQNVLFLRDKFSVLLAKLTADTWSPLRLRFRWQPEQTVF